MRDEEGAAEPLRAWAGPTAGIQRGHRRVGVGEALPGPSVWLELHLRLHKCRSIFKSSPEYSTFWNVHDFHTTGGSLQLDTANPARYTS